MSLKLNSFDRSGAAAREMEVGERERSGGGGQVKVSPREDRALKDRICQLYEELLKEHMVQEKPLSPVDPKN